MDNNNFRNSLNDTMSWYDSNINQLWQLIGQIEDNIIITERKTLNRNLNNIMLHYCLSLVDIQIGLKYLTAAQSLEDTVGGTYFSRILSVSCCCLFESKKGMTEGNIKQYHNRLSTKNYAKEADAYLIGVSKLKNRYWMEMKEIRDKVAAHKDGTGFTQLERMKKIEISKVAKASQSIFNAHYLFMPIIIKLEKCLRIEKGSK